MYPDKSPLSTLKQKAQALSLVLTVALTLLLSGFQSAHAQVETEQQLKAVITIVTSLLLGECTDGDEDTLCDVDELKYFGNLDQVAQEEDAVGDEWDFDGDGVSNGDELNLYRSNPDSENTDGDALGDFAELLIGTSLTETFDEGATLGSDVPADKAMMHKLNRLTFGPTLTELAQVEAAGGIDSWISDQLVPIGLPPAPPRDTNAVAPEYDGGDVYPSPYDCSAHNTPDPAQKMRDCFAILDDDDADVQASIRPMHSTRQLQARMAMFWDNHFNTDLAAHSKGMQELYDEDNWFVNAFGSFRTLLGLNAKNYTMLEYLDLDDNRKYSPNENFPREVMELHSVGISGGYTATDIAQLAYILTGWDHNDVRDIDGLCSDETSIITCAPFISRYAYLQEAENDGMEMGETGLDESARFNPLRMFYYKSDDHDDGVSDYDGDGATNTTKTLYFGTPHEITITSQSGANGQLEGEEALDFLATHPNTADFICTKLAQEFVADAPQAITVSNCATVFLGNTAAPNQMGLVLSNLLNSAEFNSPTTERSKTKDTQEVMFSLGRMLGWDATYLHYYSNGSPTHRYSIALRIDQAEQPLLYKAEPTGYYEPAENWLDTNIVLNRFRGMNDMVFDDDQTQSFVDYFNAIGKTSSGEIMAHLFLMMLGGNYDEHDLKVGVDILHKVDPDDPGDDELQAFDLNDMTDNLKYNLSYTSSGNSIPDPDDRIRALIARIAALPEFNLH